MEGLARAVLLGLICIIAASAGMAQHTGPNTVQYALDRPDGTRISLTMVVVGAVNSSGASVHEWWDKTTPIAAVFDPPPSLRAGQTIDLEGWMTTLPNGRRAVLAERIAFYLDSRGSVTPALPPMKGILDPSVWPAKGWIPVYPPRSSIQSLSTDGGRSVLTEEIEPPIGGDPPIVGSMSLADHSIAKAKSLADAALLTSAYTLTNKIVTAGTGQFSGFIYIEEPDRSCGIRVVPTSGSFAIGDTVDITAGTVATNANGERYVASAEVTKVGAGPVKPIGLVNRDIGGADLMNGQTVLQQGVLHGSGVNNIGLLVKTWGRVTARYPSALYFYIDDGTAPSDGSGNTGLRVESPAGMLLPSVGMTIEITGISSCTIVSGNVVRVLRVRAQYGAPAVMHVKPSGDNVNDGSTWAAAKRTVQAAINAAEPGAEIWVAEGTYNEHITLTAGRKVYGGFAGDEIRRDARNMLDNPTTLDGGGSGSVVTGASSTVIDGFTIRNGVAGVYCVSSSPTISSNIISGNAGVGVYCLSFSYPKVTNNAITGNGYGIYCSQSSPTITNNTITHNSASEGAGIYAYYYSAPPTANNIVALNNSGIYTIGGGSGPILNYNCVYGNTSYDYTNISVGIGDISADPCLAADGIRLLPDSPCINAGYDAAVQVGWLDVDGQTRTNGPHVDIGADEYHHSDGCISYALTLEADHESVEMGGTSMITVTALDVVTEEPVSGRRVDFVVADGVLVGISNDDEGSWTPDDPPTTGYGITGANGKIRAYFTRQTVGLVTVSTRASNSCETIETTESVGVWFYDPQALVDVMFLVDATGSTEGGTAITEGVTQTVDYLSQRLRTQGRTLRVAGIKFSELYSGNAAVCGNRAEFFDFTTEVAAFEQWVGSGGPGGATEYQLDILMCAKDMAPSASQDLYMALATDEDSDSTSYSVNQVRDALIQAGCIVFVDPTYVDLVSYYQPLAVNGGAVEQEAGNRATYQFHNMRLAILETP